MSKRSARAWLISQSATLWSSRPWTARPLWRCKRSRPVVWPVAALDDGIPIHYAPDIS